MALYDDISIPRRDVPAVDSQTERKKEIIKDPSDQIVLIDPDEMLENLKKVYKSYITHLPATALPPMGIDTAAHLKSMQEQPVKVPSTLEKKLVEKIKQGQEVTQNEAFEYLEMAAKYSRNLFNERVKKQRKQKVDLFKLCIETINSNPELITNKDLAKDTLSLSKILLLKLENDPTYQRKERESLAEKVYQTQKIYETFPLDFADAVDYLSSITLEKTFMQEFACNRERIMEAMDTVKREAAQHEKYPPVFLDRLFSIIDRNMNLALRPIDQKSFEQLLLEVQAVKKLNPEASVNLRKLLLFKGFRPVLEGIDFSIIGLTLSQASGSGIPPKHGTEVLKNIILDGLTFKNCGFRWVNFDRSRITDCTFQDCNLGFSVFRRCNLKNVQFKSCNLKRASFYQGKIKTSSFQDCNLQFASFNSATIDQSIFFKTHLMNATFFQTNVDKSKISNSNLSECALYGLEDIFKCEDVSPASHKNPLIALLWEVDTPGLTAMKVEKALIGFHSTPVRIHYKPDFVDPGELDKEVKSVLPKAAAMHEMWKVWGNKEDREMPMKMSWSIPMAMLEAAQEEPIKYPNIIKLLEYAREVVKSHHSLLLPGGADVEPEFFGEERTEKTSCESDYRRSIFEFALLHEARKRGLPVLGICRGSQMGNVFFGGKILQHVEGQMMKVQSYSPIPKKEGEGIGLIRAAIGKESGFRSVSVHHQASSDVPSGLETVIEYNGIPKAMEGVANAPLILLQFHPEFKNDRTNYKSKALGVLMSEENNNFWIDFLETANAYKIKAKTLGFLKRET